MVHTCTCLLLSSYNKAIVGGAKDQGPPMKLFPKYLFCSGNSANKAKASR